MKNKVNEVIAKTIKEGKGSCYERYQLNKLLPLLIKDLDCKSILEFPISVSKGWDNKAFLDSDLKVSVASKFPNKAEKTWPYSKKPRFVLTKDLSGKKFDLVWSFATIHQNPSFIPKMLKLSKKYVLFFTPNILNWGWPFHWGLHLLTRTRCKHPESGIFKLMNIYGLREDIQKRGLKILKYGFFDMPYWPDFAFSINEIKQNLPFLKFKGKDKGSQDNSEKIYSNVSSTIKKAADFEKKIPKFSQIFIAHHQYILAKK